MAERVIVVGGGINGLATAWRMRRAGWAVTLVEAGPLPNPQAASYDDHRLIRDFYADDVALTVRVGEAFTAWDALWADLGERHYVETGVLSVSRADGDETERSRATLDRLTLDHEILSADDLVRRWPFLEPAGVRYGVLRPRGGALLAERILRGLVDWLARAGATLAAGPPATAVDATTGTVTLADGRVLGGDAVVLAAGIGLRRLAPDWVPGFAAVRSTVVYLRPPPAFDAAWRSAPCWSKLDGARDLWGIAPVAGWGPKIGFGLYSTPDDPETGRAIRPDDAPTILGAYASVFRRIEAYAVERVIANFYLRAPGDRFVIDRRDRAWLVTADSGHGFKFGALTGHRVADALISGVPAAEAPRRSPLGSVTAP